MQRKMMRIFNPFSGRGISKSALGTIVSELCASDYVVSVYFAGQYTVEQLAYNFSKEHDLVVCVGGDGTLSNAVSGLMRSWSNVPIGYIPTGTANDVANTLALSKVLSTAAQNIINGRERYLDIGDFGGRFFTYIAAFGAFTGVSYQTKQSAKRALGQFAYVLGGLGVMTAIKPRRTIVEYDDGTVEGDYVFGAVVNSTSVAGLVKLDPERVDLSDGMFEIVLVRQPLNLVDFTAIVTSLSTRSYDGDNVIMLHSSRAKFTLDSEVSWVIDGEYGGDHQEIEIKNRREAIRIIV